MFTTLQEAEIPTPTCLNDAIAALEWENHLRSSSGCVVCDEALALALNLEPLTEPAVDDIPWSELAYWLDTVTVSDRLECACASCTLNPCDGEFVFIPRSFYRRLSCKIPVISLPRIEGLTY